MTDVSTVMIQSMLDGLHNDAGFYHLAQSVYTPADAQYLYYQGCLDRIDQMIKSLNIILEVVCDDADGQGHDPAPVSCVV